MAPTYFRREPGIDAPTVIAAPHSLFPGCGGASPPARRRMTEARSNDEAKAAIRREALARRAALPANFRAAASQTIAARPFPVAVKPGNIVSGFMPLKNEINPVPLLR